MSTINLVPPERLARFEAVRCARLWARRLTSVIVLLAMIYGGLLYLSAGLEDEAERLRVTYLDLKETLNGAEDLIRERDRLDERRLAIRTVQEDRASAGLLELLAKALPLRSHLDFFSLSRADDAVGTVRIRGRALGHQEVGVILSRLNAAGVFVDVRLVAVTEDHDAQSGDAVSFEIQCGLKGTSQDA